MRHQGKRAGRPKVITDRGKVKELRAGAIIELGDLDLVMCEEREVVRRLKVVHRRPRAQSS